MQEKLKRLRGLLEETEEQLKAAQAELTARRKEIEEIEGRVDGRLGALFRRLAELEGENHELEEQIKRVHSRPIYGDSYDPIEEQYQQVWVKSRRSEEGVTKSDQPKKQKSVKSLYRELARRYHPDLAESPIDRAFRNEKMAALNSAYATGSLVELLALEMDKDGKAEDDKRTEEQMARALESELALARERLAIVKQELEGIHFHPMVELSLEIKLAQRDGRNLLAEMAAELQEKIEEGEVKRRQLRRRLDQYS